MWFLFLLRMSKLSSFYLILNLLFHLFFKEGSRPPKTCLWPQVRVLPARLKGSDYIWSRTEKQRICQLISFHANLYENEHISLYISVATLSCMDSADNYLELNGFFFLSFPSTLRFCCRNLSANFLFWNIKICLWSVTILLRSKFLPGIMMLLIHHIHFIHITFPGFGYRHRLIVVFALCSGT